MPNPKAPTKTRNIIIDRQKLAIVFGGDNAAYDLRVAFAGSRMLSVLWDLDNWLRDEIKHGDRNELQPARDKLWELLNEEGLDINREDGP